MQEQERRPSQPDIRGPSRGDFTDWDNPEDEREEHPEGYYDSEAEVDEEEFNPDDPDYDLSEAAGYASWEPSERRLFLPQWLIVAVSLLLMLALLLPALRWFG